MDLSQDYYHGSELDAGGELSLAKETNPMQMKQKDWKMTNRSQDSKEATVILPKRNMKSSTERRCESWARKTLRLYVSICMCVWGKVHPTRTPSHPLNCELSESKARFAPISSLKASRGTRNTESAQ